MSPSSPAPGETSQDARRIAKRDYGRQYDREHRAALRAKSRKRYAARIPRVGPKELRAARRDPRYEERNAIRRYVICREECGAKADAITPAHLRELHGLTIEQYVKRHIGAPLFSAVRRERIGEKSRGRPRRFWRNVPGHPGQGPLRRWLVAEGIVQGKDLAEIAKSYERHADTVRQYAANMGLGSGRRRFDLGVAVANRSMLPLLKASGFDSRRFAEIFGIPRWVSAEFLRPRAAGYDVSAEHAGAIIDTRDRLILQIAELSRKTAHRWGPNLARCIRSLVPDLPRACGLLRGGLSRLREYLRANPAASVADWQDWLCDGAWNRDELLSEFLPLVAELSRLIHVETDSIRSGGRIVFVAARILAARFCLPYSAVLTGESAEPIPALELKSWIQEALRHPLKLTSGDRMYLQGALLYRPGVLGFRRLARALDPKFAGKLSEDRMRLNVTRILSRA